MGSVTIHESVDPSGRFVVLRYDSEESSPSETAAIFLSVWTRFPPDVGILVDGRAVKAPPDAQRVRGLVDRLAKHGDALGKRRIAVVYAGDKATFGMLRMAQLMGSDMPTALETLTDLEAAEEWLRS